MITYIQGDLLDFPSTSPYTTRIIAHGCNIHRCFGAGLARSIALRYPEAEGADKATTHNLGDFDMVRLTGSPDDNPRYVLNLYQQTLGASHRPTGKRLRNLNYEALYSALEGSARRISDAITGRVLPEDTGIAVPYLLGCGLAGGDWLIVSAMLHATLGSREFGLQGRLICVEYKPTTIK